MKKRLIIPIITKKMRIEIERMKKEHLLGYRKVRTKYGVIRRYKKVISKTREKILKRRELKELKDKIEALETKLCLKKKGGEKDEER